MHAHTHTAVLFVVGALFSFASSHDDGHADGRNAGHDDGHDDRGIALAKTEQVSSAHTRACVATVRF